MHKILFIFIFVLSACTLGPDFKRKDVYEDKQISDSLHLSGHTLKIDQKWYVDFHDDNLNALVAEALANNTDVIASIEKLRQARTLSKISKVTYLPMLSAQGGYDYTKASKNIGLSANSDYFTIGFDAEWELDIWGKGRRLNEQRQAEFEGVYYSLQNIKNIITAEVASTYFSLRTLQEKRRIALKNLKLQRDIFKTIEDKYQSGLSAESTYHQSAYLLKKTESMIPALNEQIEAQKNALAVLTGNLPNAIDAKLETSKQNPIRQAYRYNLKNLFDLPSDIIRTRPDVKAAEKSMAAQNAAIGQAIADLYPNVSISALLGFQANNASDLFSSSSKTYGYNPSAVLPVFRWGQLQNAVNLEREKLQESYQNYRKTLLSSVSELSNAMTAVQKQYQANKSHQSAAAHMRKAFYAVKDQYDNGIVEYAVLLESEQDLLDAETDLAQSNGDIYQKLIAFYKATGGGYNDK